MLNETKVRVDMETMQPQSENGDQEESTGAARSGPEKRHHEWGAKKANSASRGR